MGNLSDDLTDFEASEEIRRDKKGRALAEMGHVSRSDEGFDVTTTGRRRETVRVWRDADGMVRCSCSEFMEANDLKFRCEHVLAVKYYLEPPVQETPNIKPAEAIAPKESDIRSAAEYRFSKTLARLSAPLPETSVKQRVGWTDRQGNDHQVDYVEWHVVADLLDIVAPLWSHAVRNITQLGGLVAVTASITIDGVTREGIGTGEAIDEKGIKKAEHDALKRAAVKFGIARYLYRDHDDEGDDAARKRAVDNADPVARTLTDLLTPKQVVAIRAIANAAGVDAEKRALEMFNARPEELTKKAASTLIDDLKGNRADDGGRRAS